MGLYKHKGKLQAAFLAACATGMASAVGIGVGLTVAPAVLPVAAAVAAGSMVVGGATGLYLAIQNIRW